MAKFRVFIFETAAGATIVEDQMAALERTHPKGYDSLLTGLELLKELGADSGLSRFTRLRHTGGEELWELKVTLRPAVRALFAPVPGRDAYVILHIVSKSQMAADNRRQIDQALANLHYWVEEVFQEDER